MSTEPRTSQPAAVTAAPSQRSARRVELIEPLVLRHELRDFDRFPMAPMLRAAYPGIYAQCRTISASARKFSEQNLIGAVERWDQEIGRDHDLIPWPILKAAVPHGFYSMNIPAMLGGGNYGPLPTAIFAEEIAAADAGVFVLFGAHALALSLLISSLDMRMLTRLAREFRQAQDRGEPLLLALAHTEVGGGSDVEDVAEIQHARIGSTWKKVPGGYLVRARKMFISNGSIANYTVVTAYGDAKRPVETAMAFLVPQGAQGLSVGRIERKLGQRLSTAVEIICDDVFVPEADSASLLDGGRCFDTTLSLTRGPVGAMATGIIRGTLERTLDYLADKRVRGHFLFEEQHVQLALAEMLGALQAARGLYMDAALAVEHWGIGAVMRKLPIKPPAVLIRTRLYEALVARSTPLAQARAVYERFVPTTDLQRMVAHSSIAKFMCTDLSVRCAMQAMEILGEDANDPRFGVEKCLRDAKLGQIFEGTNQINRLHVVRGLLRRG